MENYLQEYYGLECPICEAMRTQLDKLEAELGVGIDRFEVWHNPDNMAKVEQFEKEKGIEIKGIPFFYNKQTGGILFGSVPYKKLKAWALGQTDI